MTTILTSLHGKQAGLDKDGYLTSPVGIKVPELHVGTSGSEVQLTATVTELNRVADASGRIVNLTTQTNLSVTEASHDGKIVTLNSTTGQAITLPAATGSGAKFEFIVGTTITSSSTTIAVANASDTMAGWAIQLADGGTTTNTYETTSATDTITFNGTTTGGIKGDRVRLVDMAANVYHVEVIGAATGTEAIPFSAAV